MHGAIFLDDGTKMLEGLLSRHGFTLERTDEWHRTAGPMARGAFVRGARRMELLCRRSRLELVTYHLGPAIAVAHETLMVAVHGPTLSHRFPGFSKQPLDAFHDLIHDLERYGQVFLSGTDEEFTQWVARAEQFPHGRKGFHGVTPGR